MLKKIGLFTMCTASVFAMHDVGLNINDKDLEVVAKFDMGQFNDTTDAETVFVGVKFLHASEDNSDDIDDSLEMHDYAEMNFLMKREIEGSGGLSIGMGVKINYTQTQTEKFTTIPLGIEAEYALGISSAVPMSVGASIYYAPEVLSMQDAKNFVEYRVEFEAELIKDAFVLAGFRNLNTNYDTQTGTTNYNKSPYIGFKFAY